MNKSELVSAIAKRADITQVEASKALDCFMQSVEKTLKKKDKVALVGFGTFSVTSKAARQGRNPQTGEVIQIPSKNVPKFKAGVKLAEAVN